MRKLILGTMLGIMSIFAVATMASAAPYYHGDFASDSTGCAKCHVTHAADAARLLIAGPTQTDFCYYCHNDVTKSPYDAMNGKIDTTTGVMPSVAGGFAKTFNFDAIGIGATDLKYSEDATYGGGADVNFIASTSVHGVEKMDSNVWQDGVTIPGGSTALSGDFRCGSCHDPHAGGLYNGDGSDDVMPRLLKKDLPAGADFDPTTFGAWTVSKAGVGTNSALNTWTVAEYGDDVSDWCAGCHDYFNQTAHLAGQNAEANTGKYMHRIDFSLSAAGKTTLGAQDAIEDIPLSKNGKLTCLTCHRAHGTASTADNVGTFNRAAAYMTTAGSTNTKNTSTILLRQKNRDVCYNCHKEATENTPSIQGS